MCCASIERYVLSQRMKCWRGHEPSAPLPPAAPLLIANRSVNNHLEKQMKRNTSFWKGNFPISPSFHKSLDGLSWFPKKGAGSYTSMLLLPQCTWISAASHTRLLPIHVTLEQNMFMYTCTVSFKMGKQLQLIDQRSENRCITGM